MSKRSSAAVMILVRQSPLLGSEVLLIERSATVRSHQGQVAFPGGGVEEIDGNDPVRTALRECEEEVGVPTHLIRVTRTLQPLPTLTSGFFVHPVLGELTLSSNEELNLNLDPHEVAYAEWVSVESLQKTKKIELGLPIFAWQGKDQKTRKVWGLTAIIFDLIFKP